MLHPVQMAPSAYLALVADMEDLVSLISPAKFCALPTPSVHVAVSHLDKRIEMGFQMQPHAD